MWSLVIVKLCHHFVGETMMIGTLVMMMKMMKTKKINMNMNISYEQR